MHHRLTPLLALAVVLGGLLAGCGIDEDVVAREAAEAGSGPTTTAPGPEEPAPPGRDEPEEPEEAEAFTVEDVPAGYELVVEGPGEDEATDDQRPVTVLAPAGGPEGAGVVFVEPAPEDAEDDFLAATDDDPWARLVDGGVQVHGLDATEDDLRAVAAATDPPSAPGGAPAVPEPPDGLEVVGALDLDAVVALAAGVPADEDGPVPGPAAAEVGVWRCADDCDGSLVVMSLPTGSLDPAAVVSESRTPRRTSGDPRDSVVTDEIGPVEDVTWRGVVVDTADPASGVIVRRTAAVETERGVILLVARGQDLLTGDDLVEVAESVALG